MYYLGWTFVSWLWNHFCPFTTEDNWIQSKGHSVDPLSSNTMKTGAAEHLEKEEGDMEIDSDSIYEGRS